MTGLVSTDGAATDEDRGTNYLPGGHQEIHIDSVSERETAPAAHLQLFWEVSRFLSKVLQCPKILVETLSWENDTFRKLTLIAEGIGLLPLLST